MNSEKSTMTTTPNDRKKAVALARKTHHKKQLNENKRVDTYIKPETKAGLLRIKAHFSDVKNEGQAIDKALGLALESLDKIQQNTE